MLSDWCTLNPKHPPSTNRQQMISFVPMKSVDGVTGKILTPINRPLEELWKGFTHFQNGDVIFAKITPCMENGKIAIAADLTGGIACGSTEFHVLRSNVTLDPYYLWCFLRQKSFRAAAEGSMTGAVGHRRVPKSYLEQTQLPLPPLAEQKRIVAKLESLSAKSTRARGDLTKIDTLVTRYKQAVLQKAFSGELTKEWREQKGYQSNAEMLPIEKIPLDWRIERLGDVAEIQSGVALGKKRKAGVELFDTPYLRVANVQRGWLNLDKIKQTAVTSTEAKKLYLQRGDILMNEGGDRDKLGRGWVWEGQIDHCIHQNHVFRVRLKNAAFPPRFLSYFANEFGQRHFFDKGKQTTNLASISKSKLSTMNIPMPSADEASAIVLRVEELFEKITRLALEAKQALELVGRLDEAILAKAFKGELVPQDPKDEPASVLLDRIHTERGATAKPKKTRKRAKAKST